MIDRGAFARDGFVLVPGVVSEPSVATARRAINNWFVNGFDSSKLALYASRSSAPELTESNEILGLCTRSPLLDLATDLVGQPLLPPMNAQIALRFPAALDAAVPEHAAEGHIDGLPSASNGVPRDGRVHGFTVLAGVFLSDVPAGAHGNFTVWPGTHMEMAAWFARNGTTVDDPDLVFAEATRLSPPPGLALAARPGDVVLAHHLLVHTAGPHSGPDVRYAVFFRLRVRPWGDEDDRVLTDPWHEYLDMPRGAARAGREGAR